MTVKSLPCPGCERVISLELPAESVFAWQNGMLIQRAFPSLTDSQRESLITGYCDPCWDALFAEEDQ